RRTRKTPPQPTPYTACHASTPVTTRLTTAVSPPRSARHWMPTLRRLEHLTDLRLAPMRKPRLLPPNRSRRRPRQPAQPPPPLPSGSSGGQIAGLMPVLGVVPSRPSRVSGHPTGAGALPP